VTSVLLFAGVLPDNIMNTPWSVALSTFVAVNTLLYLTLAIVKTLPKAYLSDWIDQRNRRSESRSIYPDVAAGGPVRAPRSTYRCSSRRLPPNEPVA
jgi:hypothetical protein